MKKLKQKRISSFKLRVPSWKAEILEADTSLTKFEKSDHKVNFKIFQTNMQDVKKKLLDIEVIPNE